MTKLNQIATALFLFLLGSTYSFATHITGGELIYECLGNNNYKIVLKLYRDCMYGEAGFDDPCNISVWDGSMTLVTHLEVPFTGSTQLPYIAADTNWVPLGSECVEVATYTIISNIPASPTGLTFAYQRCCRTGSIINMLDPLTLGSTYWEEVPSVDLCNNSPSFINHPPLALCINRPMSFSHAATDLDGDSLVYYFCNSYNGANPSSPQPIIADPPPYDFIPYQLPYTNTNPLPGLPAIAINELTGQITITPSSLGNFMVAVCCDEYRNGNLIGSHHSDFRYTVAECPYGIGIEESYNEKFLVYPNPAQDLIFINGTQEFSMEIYNLMGQLVYASSNEEANFKLFITEYPTGIYNCRINSEGLYYWQRFIKN